MEACRRRTHSRPDVSWLLVRLQHTEGDRMGDPSNARKLVGTRDEACEPCSLNEAKARALAMAKGAVGDYVVENPIQHLNRLAARLGGDAS